MKPNLKPLLDGGMRMYRIKQIGHKFYLETLDIHRPRLCGWKFWKTPPREVSETLVWRIVGQNGGPAEMPDTREFWGTHNPVLDGFDTVEDAAAKIDEFRESQRVAYYYHKSGDHE